MTPIPNETTVRAEKPRIMNRIVQGVFKVLPTTFTFACIWTLIDPYGDPDDTPVAQDAVRVYRVGSCQSSVTVLCLVFHIVGLTKRTNSCL